MSQLYPPIIGEKIPAFYYQAQGPVKIKIKIPFSMNPAVNIENVTGFNLKIKTVQTETVLMTISVPKPDNENFLKENEIIFTIGSETSDDQEKIKLLNTRIGVGEFLKVQIAYIGQDNVIGHYSHTSIVKYTSQPNIFIKEFSNEDDYNKIFPFISVCTGVYQFTQDTTEYPYSYNFLLYSDENKNELIEESGWKNYNASAGLEKIYSFTTPIGEPQSYFIEYKVKTINGLEESSGLYECIKPEITKNNFLELKAENIFEEGYINLSLSILENQQFQTNTYLNIYREDIYNNNSTVLLQKFEFLSEEDFLTWNLKDFTIEQGNIYRYSFRYDINGVESEPFGNIEVVADFEDMFLWDGERQIKIRFNPKVSSFKIDRLEQKVETIGNRFPSFFRNSNVNYKEFPISGLISYYLDDNELFLIKDVNNFPEIRSFLNQNLSYKTLDLLGHNISMERRFKLYLLDWLNNGKIKMFKSPSEGNYLIRLLNISLSPEDRLGRMLHTFSCNAYEVEEFSYNNLIKIGLISINTFTENFQNIDSLDFTFYTQKLYGSSEEPFKNILSILNAENDSINGFDGEDITQKNILIFKNKNVQKVRYWSEQKLEDLNNNQLQDSTQPNPKSLTTYIPNFTRLGLSLNYDDIYENPRILSSNRYYYYNQDNIFLGPEKKDCSIAIVYQDAASENKTININMNNLLESTVTITYKYIENSNNNIIDTIRIKSIDINNQIIINTYVNNSSLNITKITLPNGVYLERIVQRQGDED